MAARRNDAIKAFEEDAETLVVYQTDIIAQIESQLRAARQAIRLVQKLRGVPYRVGPEPTDTQRHETLDSLSKDWEELDAQLTTQHECCLEIQKTITQMGARLQGLHKLARTIRPSASPARRNNPETSS